MTEDGLEEGNRFIRNVVGMTVPRDNKRRVGPGGKNAFCAFATDAARKPLRKLDASKGEWGSCEWHRCSSGTGVYADLCGFRSDDYIGTGGFWVSNPARCDSARALFLDRTL